MGQITIKPIEWGDDRVMAPKLRLADIREVIAGTGLRPDDALAMSVRISDKCWVGWENKEPIAIFGCRDSTNEEGSSANVWLLGTDHIQDVSWQFLRKSKEWMSHVSKDYDVLWAVSDSRNKVHQKWYEWLGFDVIQTLLVGPFSLPFYHIMYTKDKTNV
mgnify:CR=1 FL=1